MKRNIMATIEFSRGSITVNILEKLPNNIVELYTSQGSPKDADAFLSKSMKEVNNLIGGDIHDVVVVVEPSETVDGRIFLTKETISIASDTVSKKDVDNLIKLTKQKHSKVDKEIILIQPLSFDVEGIERKNYLKAPLFKQGEKLHATMAITEINSEVVNWVNLVVKAQNLNITQILLKPQTISQNNLSENAIFDGSILVHVGKGQSFVSINKNHATIDFMSFYKSGLSQLIDGVAKIFHCTFEEAENLITIYGTFQGEENRVIYTHEEGIQITTHTISELKSIIKTYANRLLTLAKKFIDQKDVAHLPVVFSGEITKIEDFDKFAHDIFEGNLSIYEPMNFVEINNHNHGSIGVLNFNSRLDNVLGKQFNTIVETNPNTFASLRRPKKTLWAKIIDKVGGRNYDWHN